MSELFYICDMRSEWQRKPYVTFWRPSDAGYAFPLSWSGQYTLDRIFSQPGYYWAKNTRGFYRFPILCSSVDRLGSAPIPGTVDGDAGPIIHNTKSMRSALRAAAVAIPASALSGEAA